MKKYGAGIGGVSLILVFSVLCLTVFALLTLSEAKRERSLTEKLKSSVENYYSADSASVEVAAKLREYVSIGEIPLNINHIEIKNDENEVYMYLCPIDERRLIEVKLRIRDGKTEILCWKVKDTGKWEPKDQLNVWGGE